MPISYICENEECPELGIPKGSLVWFPEVACGHCGELTTAGEPDGDVLQPTGPAPSPHISPKWLREHPLPDPPGHLL